MSSGLIGMSIFLICYSRIVPSHDSTGESLFYLLYGRDARIPTESALSAKRTPYQVDVDNHRSELVHILSEAWRIAKDSVAKAQKRQKRAYDRHSRPKTFRGDRIMVYMPCQWSELVKISSSEGLTLALTGYWRCTQMA